MLTRALISVLDTAQSPRTIHAAAWALERVTGVRTADLVERKDVAVGAEWYQHEGFYRLAGSYGNGSSYSGKTVTFDSALESAALYACVKIISEDMGGLPFFPYERDASGKSVEKAYKSSLYRLLHDAPNDEMSAGEFREALTARACLGIDGFAKIERGRESGQVVMLWPYTNATVTPRRNNKNQLCYVVKDGNSAEQNFKREDIFHLKGFTIDGISGDQILKRARHAIGLTLSGDEYAGRFFANDASPGVVLSVPPGVKYGPEKVKEIKDAWKKWHQGLSKAHEPAVLQDGTTMSRADPDHQKLQIIESRKFQVVEIARIYRMPLHKLADLDRSTNNNIEHQGLEYVQHSLGPWRRRWEEAVHRCLLTQEQRYHPNGRPRMFAEFNVESLQRGDFATQTKGLTAFLEKGVYSINEVRKLFNLNPVPDGDGHYVQLNMQDVATAAQVATQATPAPTTTVQ